MSRITCFASYCPVQSCDAAFLYLALAICTRLCVWMQRESWNVMCSFRARRCSCGQACWQRCCEVALHACTREMTSSSATSSCQLYKVPQNNQKKKKKNLACRARRCSCGRTCQRRCMCVKQYQILQHVHVICELCWYNHEFMPLACRARRCGCGRTCRRRCCSSARCTRCSASRAARSSWRRCAPSSAQLPCFHFFLLFYVLAFVAVVRGRTCFWRCRLRPTDGAYVLCHVLVLIVCLFYCAPFLPMSLPTLLH